ncbi:MAG: SUMF1/EgtB/PvdO family nonheme iron enzyme, partial [Bacteroidota bacterium]
MSEAIRIFIAYSRQDAALLDDLRKHLRPLERTGKVKIWYDGNIEPGAVWEDAIKKNLHAADIILPLVSADAINSDYFYEKEIADALIRHDRGEARVVPLILRPCVWKTTPLHRLQALPKDGKPVTSWADRDDAWSDAVGALWNYVEAKERQVEAEKLRREEDARRQSELEKQQVETLAAQAAAERQRRQAAEAQQQREAQQRLAAAEAAERQRQQAEAAEAKRREAERQRQQMLENQRLEKERKRREAETRRQQAGGGKRMDWRIPVGAAGVLLLVFVIWKIAAGGSGETGTSTAENAADTTSQQAQQDNFAAGAMDTNRIEAPENQGNTKPPKTSTETQPAEKPPENKKTAAAFSDPFADDLVRIEGGTFDMGCEAARDGECKYDDEKPPHQVTVSSFSLCRYEVTHAQWRAVMGKNPSDFKCNDCPVENVSWNDVQEFIKKLNLLTGKDYRLPTEAEWEFAARGGNQSNGYKYAGSNEPGDV